MDKTSEKLDGINKLSAQRYLDATRDFSNHTQMLTTMKTDLDLIFKRIKYNKKKKQTNSIYFSLQIIIHFRLLKIKLNKKYPEAYASGNILLLDFVFQKEE